MYAATYHPTGHPADPRDHHGLEPLCVVHVEAGEPTDSIPGRGPARIDLLLTLNRGLSPIERQVVRSSGHLAYHRTDTEAVLIVRRQDPLHLAAGTVCKFADEVYDRANALVAADDQWHHQVDAAIAAINDELAHPVG